MAPPAQTLEEVGREVAAVGLANYPKGSKPNYGYGTAGFRAAGEGLDHIMFRMGILAALRSKFHGGKAVGVMVTASHNPECDNGVKVVEPMGEMLAIDWEGHATKLANAADDELAAVFVEIAKACGLAADVPASVLVARDTRKSSARLSLAVIDGASVVQPGSTRSLGLTSTPQLHYVLRCLATGGAYGVPTVGGHIVKLTQAYAALVRSSPAAANPKKYVPRVLVDCANGVGSIVMRQMLQPLKDAGLSVELANEGAGVLNEGCGSDFVKVKQCQPSNVDSSQVRCSALDGDADRVVFFFGGAGGSFRLLDGDRIALLFASFLAGLLKQAGIASLRLGVVQTAYANGAATTCAVKAVGEANVLCAKTGVKHCHHAAESLDIGIYFEANGHGTVLFGEAFGREVAKAAKTATGEAASAVKQLQCFRDVINEAVGDAISGVLAVEAVLNILDWSCEDWLAMYTDLPNRETKVVVKDRLVVETADAERKCVKPEGLQAEIDRLVSETPSGRAFVRPSGTEDVVRVYAEAATSEGAVKLAQAVADLVYDRVGGVGARVKVA